MIPLPCRTKGGAPLLGAKGPGQRGPFGEWPDADDDQDVEDDPAQRIPEQQPEQ